MRTTKLFQGTCLIRASLFICSAALGADNCTGYDSLVGISVETLDLGNGHTLTAFRQASMLTSENSIYQLATGECLGAALSTPDGKCESMVTARVVTRTGIRKALSFRKLRGLTRAHGSPLGGRGSLLARPTLADFKT